MVRFAAANGLTVSPRGGGHNYEASPLRDGGILLDLGGARQRRDRRGRPHGEGRRGNPRQRAQREARRARLGLPDRPLRRRRAERLPHQRRLRLERRRMGRRLRQRRSHRDGDGGAATSSWRAPTTTADLFWAARGAGPGFFAAVTAFHLKLHPLPPTAYAWRGAFAATSAPELADWLDRRGRRRARRRPRSAASCSRIGTPASTRSCCASRPAATTRRTRGEKIAPFTAPPRAARMIGEVKDAALCRSPSCSSSRRCPPESASRPTTCGATRRSAICCWRSTRCRRRAADSTIDIVAFGGHTPVAVPAERGAHRQRRHRRRHLRPVGRCQRTTRPTAPGSAVWTKRCAPFRTGRYVGEADLTLGPQRRGECFTPDALERLGSDPPALRSRPACSRPGPSLNRAGTGPAQAPSSPPQPASILRVSAAHSGSQRSA